MFAIQLKPLKDLPELAGERFAVLCCEGCKEVYFPDGDIGSMLDELSFTGTLVEVITCNSLCNANISGSLLIEKSETLSDADYVLIISCGVGVQTIAGLMRTDDVKYFNRTLMSVTDKTFKVVAACDTFPIPGHQGVTPSRYNCVMCGTCHLNLTGGLCPVTSCSKGLVSGECGGSKDGMCEVDPKMECGWEKIKVRLSLRP